jgi:hypothetical protein
MLSSHLRLGLPSGLLPLGLKNITYNPGVDFVITLYIAVKVLTAEHCCF